MPIQWNAENHAKMLGLLFKHPDIKITATVMQDLADGMGSGCTAKAITHQIAKFRNGVYDSGATATPKKRASPTKGAKGKATKCNKKTAADESDEEDHESPSKRAKTESDVKAEMDEDDYGEF